MPPRRARNPANQVAPVRRTRLALPAPEPAPPAPNQKCKENFMQVKHYAPVWVFEHELRMGGLYEEVREILTAAGWTRLLTLRSNADKEDTAEFLGSYKLNERTRTISYEHRGVKHTASFAELGNAFGWRPNGRISDLNDINMAEKWTDLTGYTRYEPSRSISRKIRYPALFYLHFALARTIFAKKSGADKVSKEELAVLDLLRRRERVDWAYYFCEHVKKMRATSPVCVGGMVTHLLRTLHPDSPTEGRPEILFDIIDYYKLKKGKHIRERRDGTYQWIYHTDPERCPPRSPRRVGRPPSSTDESETQPQRGVAGVDFGESSAQGAAQHSRPQWNQGQIDSLFNSARYLLIGGAIAPPCPAPPGWLPNQPVPEEFLRPYFPPSGPM